MRHRILTLVATAALLGAAGCGDNEADDEQAATTTAPAAGEVTEPARDAGVGTDTTDTQTTAATRDGELSPEGRAVLDATQDLAADVSDTAEEFARGRIDQDEATARLELAGDRAEDLQERAQQLPDAERAGERLAALNEEIGRTASEISQEVSRGREASRDDIERRIEELRDEARSTLDVIRDQLDERTERRVREALDRIGIR
ncbi:MAG: hypothetical protein KY433_08445 [Actinobacteria bacterium]|nr:hypothetical protein [Actinomycetota bacterium]